MYDRTMFRPPFTVDVSNANVDEGHDTASSSALYCASSEQHGQIL